MISCGRCGHDSADAGEAFEHWRTQHRKVDQPLVSKGDRIGVKIGDEIVVDVVADVHKDPETGVETITTTPWQRCLAMNKKIAGILDGLVSR